jgi:hypothetical protein
VPPAHPSRDLPPRRWRGGPPRRLRAAGLLALAMTAIFDGAQIELKIGKKRPVLTGTSCSQPSARDCSGNCVAIGAESPTPHSGDAPKKRRGSASGTESFYCTDALPAPSPLDCFALRARNDDSQSSRLHSLTRTLAQPTRPPPRNPHSPALSHGRLATALRRYHCSLLIRMQACSPDDSLPPLGTIPH